MIVTSYYLVSRVIKRKKMKELTEKIYYRCQFFNNILAKTRVMTANQEISFIKRQNIAYLSNKSCVTKLIIVFKCSPIW